MEAFSYTDPEFNDFSYLELILLVTVFIISFTLLIGAYYIKMKRIDRENTSFFKMYSDLI